MIDDWTIVKLLGGSALIMASFTALISKMLSTKIEKTINHNYDKKLQNLKGEIDRNNSILNSTIQNYFSSSQKILDKKILAYEIVWNSILQIKKDFPAGVLVVHQLITDSELEKEDAHKTLNDNEMIGTLLRSYNGQKEVEKMLNDDELLKYKPYLSDQTYKLFYTYRALIGRVTHSFILEFNKGLIYHWKKDESLKKILEVTLTSQELNYVFEIQLDSLSRIIELVEYKILQDFRSSLNIKDSTNDSIKYVKDIEEILNPK
jgi:hypothetical protein